MAIQNRTFKTPSYIPLNQPMSQAQVDFFEADILLHGNPVTVHGASFSTAFPRMP
jgi:hypothetical protein